MCKKIITLFDDNYKVEKYRIEIKEDTFQYVLQKKSIITNKDTNTKEECWNAIGYYPNISQLINSLTKKIALDKLEKEYQNQIECNITLKKYVTLLNDTEKEICNILKGF